MNIQEVSEDILSWGNSYLMPQDKFRGRKH